MKLCLLITFALLAASPALASDLFIRDGDSFSIDGQEVRLWGIDAPEYHQTCFKDGSSVPCGKYARQRLEKLTKGADLQCERINTDRYKRTVARCYVHGEDLAALMVRAGFAFDYPRYSKGTYSKQQKAAKNELRGLWSMKFDMPWICKRKK
jgi:endonuclease YncB( thermonuclease family)